MKIRIEPVSSENRAQAEALSVREEQKNYIETTAECLREADALSLWRPLLIYADNQPAGFAMIGHFQEEGESERVWLDRFLIDQRFQGRGIASVVLPLLIQKIQKSYQCRKIYLSVIDGNNLAVALYEKLGFRFTGEMDGKGEKIMCLAL